MKPKQHTVWTWVDAENVVRFAGYGMFKDVHPAEERFSQRFNGDSELDIWLQSLGEEPERRTFGKVVVSLAEAVGMTMGLRNRHADTLLRTRGPSTYSGGYPPKAVYRFCAEDVSKCDVFSSVREAARHMGCHPSTITRWCADDENESWGYVDSDIELT